MYRIRNEQGFTMVEVLIAMAIAGLVITAVYSFYFSGVHSWQKGLTRTDLQQSARIAMDFMVRELRFASDVVIVDDVEGKHEINFWFTDDNEDAEPYIFRLNGDELDYYYPGNPTPGKVAQGITWLHFAWEKDKQNNDTNVVSITVTAGDESASVTMQSSVRPRNLR